MSAEDGDENLLTLILNTVFALPVFRRGVQYLRDAETDDLTRTVTSVGWVITLTTLVLWTVLAILVLFVSRSDRILDFLLRLLTAIPLIGISLAIATYFLKTGLDNLYEEAGEPSRSDLVVSFVIGAEMIFLAMYFRILAMTQFPSQTMLQQIAALDPLTMALLAPPLTLLVILFDGVYIGILLLGIGFLASGCSPLLEKVKSFRD